MAAELLDGSGDGVWLAELAAVTDQDAVPAAICEALRLTGQPDRHLVEPEGGVAGDGDAVVADRGRDEPH